MRDTVYEDDLIIEDTFDWYAQDEAGNVWYFGERVVNYEYDDEGNFIGINNEGEWSSDDPGNQPGLQAKAEPEVGPAIYLEYAPGVAEDETMTIATGLRVETPFGTYRNVIQNIDSSVLSTGIEFKYYARGIGEITEREVQPDGSTGTVVNLYRTAGRAAGWDRADDFTLALSALREGKAVEERRRVARPRAGGFRRNGRGEACHGDRRQVRQRRRARRLSSSTRRPARSPGPVSWSRISPRRRRRSLEIEVPKGKTLGLFLVRAADEIGVDLENSRTAACVSSTC